MPAPHAARPGTSPPHSIWRMRADTRASYCTVRTPGATRGTRQQGGGGRGPAELTQDSSKTGDSPSWTGFVGTLQSLTRWVSRPGVNQTAICTSSDMVHAPQKRCPYRSLCHLQEGAYTLRGVDGLALQRAAVVLHQHTQSLTIRNPATTDQTQSKRHLNGRTNWTPADNWFYSTSEALSRCSKVTFLPFLSFELKKVSR